jgi:hypothetical protein
VKGLVPHRVPKTYWLGLVYKKIASQAGYLLFKRRLGGGAFS